MEMERTIAMFNAARGRLKEFVRYLEFWHIQMDYGKRRKLEEMREELKDMKDQIRKRVGCNNFWHPSSANLINDI